MVSGEKSSFYFVFILEWLFNAKVALLRSNIRGDVTAILCRSTKNYHVDNVHRSFSDQWRWRNTRGWRTVRPKVLNAPGATKPLGAKITSSVTSEMAVKSRRKVWLQDLNVLLLR